MDLFHLSISFSRWAEVRRERQLVAKDCQHYFDLMQENHLEIKHLSAEQKKAVDAIYGKYASTTTGKYTYQTHELYYSATGTFAPEVVPEVLFRNHINFRMNDNDRRKAWADKNYYELLHPDGRFPQAIVRNVDGKYLDANFKSISLDEASRIISAHDKVIVKPSMYGGFGRRVSLVENPQDMTEIAQKFKTDFIVQEPFRQHKDMAILNESSVNVVRLITLYIDDKPEVLMAGMRVGNVGALTDYSPTKSGTGSVILGVDEHGKLRKYGYNSCGKQVTQCANGFVFENFNIPDYQGMCELALRLHGKMPMFRFIAWDMVTDESGKATVMEYNLARPGVLYYQWVNGPLFGTDPNRIHYIIKKLRRSN